VWIKDVICCMKQAGWMAKSKVALDYKLEHTNKELDGSLPLSSWFFSSALMLALLLRDRVLHGVAPSKCSRPLLRLHYSSFHLMILL
jgi:hypothetical protein